MHDLDTWIDEQIERASESPIYLLNWCPYMVGDAREFSKKYGVGPTKALKCLKGRIFNKYLKGYKEHIAKLALVPIWQKSSYKARGNTMKIGLDTRVLVRMSEFDYRLLDGLVKDGIYNLAPVLLLLKRDVSRCREALGRGLWAKICKNSLHRNKLIFNKCCSDLVEVDIAQIKVLSAQPSTLLIHGLIAKEPEKYKIFCRKNKIKLIENGLFTTWNDAHTMAEKLGKKLNLRTITQLNKTHTKLIEEINTGKYTKERFISAEVHELRIEGWTINQLLSPFALHAEGQTMHHCIVSYETRIAMGRYCAYAAVNDTTGERCTIGLWINYRNNNNWEVDQIQGLCNKNASLAHADVEQAIKKLNYKPLEQLKIEYDEEFSGKI